MINKKLVLGIVVWASLMWSCLDPYKPHEVTQNVRYLVVDGFFNTTDSICTITLTRTLPLDGTVQVPMETKAHLQLVDNAGEIYPMIEQTPGVYSVSGVIAATQRLYKINITTSNNSSYSSDFVLAVPTPPIDSIEWKLVPSGVGIFVNTHDPSSKTGYYRWRFTENWQYHSEFRSHLQVNSAGAVVQRTDDIYDCYLSNSPADIRIFSTARLSENIVSEFPLATIPTNSIKFQTRYSIMVEQRALTSDYYQYAQLLKNTTEDLGTLFDPLPTTVFGNIHNLSDPGETVIGYFSAGAVSTKRIFITKDQVDPAKMILSDSPYYTCKIDSIFLSDLSPLKYLSPYDDIFLGDSQIIIGYYASTPECVDCRLLLGGTNVAPSFW